MLNWRKTSPNSNSLFQGLQQPVATVVALIHQATVIYLLTVTIYTLELAAARLEEWQTFELNRLSVIADYIERSHVHKVVTDNGTYELPLGKMKQPAVILACEIGERTLYFDISDYRHPDHPFRLVSLEQ
jgi:hypothetical protein